MQANICIDELQIFIKGRHINDNSFNSKSNILKHTHLATTPLGEFEVAASFERRAIAFPCGCWGF